jgi:predicted enzyme involved in methoxymalonyl-ACP biosynthesis
VQAHGREETQRQAMSRAAVLRQAAPKVASFVMASADDPRFPRIFALVNKTNQFNTSDKR